MRQSKGLGLVLLLTPIFVLAVLQGLTAFLPVSYSSHGALAGALLGWVASDPSIILAVQAGSVLAACAYFATDLWAMSLGLARLVRGKRDPAARLAFQLVVASIPVMAATYAYETYANDVFRQIAVIGWATLGYGLVLLAIDKSSMTIKRVEHATYADLFLLGCAQALALMPGTSRAGIAMTMARFLGYERPAAARLAILASIPAIVGSAAWLIWRTGTAPAIAVTQMSIAAGAASFVASLGAIAVLMAWLKRRSFTPFVIYRVVLGAAILAVAYGYIGAAGG